MRDKLGMSFNDVFANQEYAKDVFNNNIHVNKFANRGVKTITFQITEDCSLRCSYCYQINKKKNVMSLDTAKKFIDMLIEDSYNEDSYFYIEDSQAVVLEFIGGEPLLEVDLIDDIIQYFLYKTIKDKHIWAKNYMISFISNGVHYFEPKVQALFDKYRDRLSFAVSIDGCKELHDSCRVFPDGRGSYDIVEKACKHYIKNYNPKMNTKMTLAPNNISWLHKAFQNLIDLGYQVIFANPIFEKGWEDVHARIYYEELIKVANLLIDNGLYDSVYTSLFDEKLFTPLVPEENQNFCGTTGYMLALHHSGSIYTCIRFMESALGDEQEPYSIGHVDYGIGRKPMHKHRINLLDEVTRRSQSTDECFNCPVGGGCAWCTANNYQETGSVNKRITHICMMHKARSLANVYYWNKVYALKNIDKKMKMHIPMDDALNIVDKEEYEYLYRLQE